MADYHDGISPQLVSLLTNTPGDRLPSPLTITDLPSRYAAEVAARAHQVPLRHPVNPHHLKCRLCGTWGEYNLGLIVTHLSPKDGSATNSAPNERSSADILAACTGYFRCHYCNGTDWELPAHFNCMLAFRRIVERFRSLERKTVVVGRVTLGDGFAPRWMTDAEEHWLDVMRKTGEDAYLWDRLGNLYLTGARPELAMVAFERAVQLDPMMVESLFSIGLILVDIDKPEDADRYFSDALRYGHRYERMAPEKLRELLANALRELVLLHADDLDTVLPLLGITDRNPTAGGLAESAHDKRVMDLGRIKRFYPIADSYMSSTSGDHSSPQRHPSQRSKIGRNQPCPCKSGKKYKKCCGA